MNIPLVQRYTRPRSVLGISLESRQLTVAWVRRANGANRLVQSLTLPLKPETILEDPEKAGRDLAARLEAAGIREERCAVCLPISWALTAPVDLPAVAADDLHSYFELRAEREFPLPPSDLHLAHSVYHLADGKSQATLAAIPTKRFESVRRMLAAAQRRPASVCLGIDHCLEEASAAGSINFLPNDNHLDLVLCAGGGVAGVRSLTGLSPALPDGLQAPSLHRELRITLGRLPAPLREQIRVARFFGPTPSVESLRELLDHPLRQMGIARIVPPQNAPAAQKDGGPALDSAAPAFVAADRYLQGQPAAFEFVAPQIGKWELFVRRLNTGRHRRGGLILGVMAATLLIPFFWRIHVERRLSAEWAQLQPRVTEVEALQRKIRLFRPWFNTSLTTLQVLEGLTSCFPEEGTVWSRTVEISDAGQVTCTGFARSQPAFMDVVDGLRAHPRIAELKVQQVRGDNPIQFTLSFSWENERSE